MGFFDVLTAPVNLEIMLKTKKDLVKNLKKASEYLEYMEPFLAERHKVAEYRGKVDKTIEVLMLPETAYDNVKSAFKIAKAVSDLNKIRYIHQQPDRAAWAFGRLFAGLGELSNYLPFPISGYFEIFTEAQMFFVNIRRKRDMRVHMKEPGALEAAGLDYDF